MTQVEISTHKIGSGMMRLPSSYRHLHFRAILLFHFFIYLYIYMCLYYLRRGERNRVPRRVPAHEDAVGSEGDPAVPRGLRADGAGRG
jgi:hypothetical protein